MSPYTITAVGWQWYLREYGKPIGTYDTRAEAEQARRGAQVTL